MATSSDSQGLANLDLLEVARVAESAARRAGDILLEKLGRLDESLIRSKSIERDLVTEADVASERLLVDELRRSFPSHAIEAEEEVRDDASDAPRWFLDPLDGTINYVHRLPAFTVSMGLYSGLQPLVSIVHAPRLDETFVATLGGGAFLNGEPISVSPAESIGESVLATGFPYLRGQLEHDNVENFNRFVRDVRGIRRMGSAALDLAYTAAGRLDGFWELHLSPHDVAAGALLVREAGGVVTDADGGEEWLRGGHVVASGPALHPLIRERIQH